MKVIFLDIDGVLNNTATKERSVTGFVGLDKRLVNLFLSWYKKQEDVKIVLSSTWRTDPIMVQEIEDAGIPIFGMTPRTGDTRGQEIALWLKDVEVSRYVILDDNSDMLSSQKPFFVQTSYVHGLRPRNLFKMEKILNQ